MNPSIDCIRILQKICRFGFKLLNRTQVWALGDKAAHPASRCGCMPQTLRPAAVLKGSWELDLVTRVPQRAPERVLQGISGGLKV